MPTNSKLIKLTILSLIFILIQATLMESEVNEKTVDPNQKNNNNEDNNKLKQNTKKQEDQQIQVPKQQKIKSVNHKKGHKGTKKTKKKKVNHQQQNKDQILHDLNLQFQKPQEKLKIKDAIIFQPEIKQYTATKSDQLYPQKTYERSKTPESFIGKKVENNQDEKKVAVIQKDQKIINQINQQLKQNDRQVDVQKLNKVIQQQKNIKNTIENESEEQQTQANQADQASAQTQKTVEVQKVNREQTKQEVIQEQEKIRQKRLHKQYENRLSAFNKKQDDKFDQQQKLIKQKKQRIAQNEQKIQEINKKVIQQKKNSVQQRNAKQAEKKLPALEESFDHQNRIVQQQKTKEKQLQAAQQSKKIADQTPMQTKKQKLIQDLKESVKMKQANTDVNNNNKQIEKQRLEEQRMPRQYEKKQSAINKARDEELQQLQKQNQQQSQKNGKKEAQQKQILEEQKKIKYQKTLIPTVIKPQQENQPQKSFQKQDANQKNLKIEENKNTISSIQLQEIISNKYQRFETQYMQKIKALQIQMSKEHKINSQLNNQYKQLLQRLTEKQKAQKNVQTEILQSKKQFDQLLNEFYQYKTKNEQRLDKISVNKPVTSTVNDEHTVFIANENILEEQKKQQVKDNLQLPIKKEKVLVQDDPDMDLLNKVIQARRKKQEQAKKRMEDTNQAKKQIINAKLIPQTQKPQVAGSNNNDVWFYASFTVIVIAILYLRRKSNKNQPKKVSFYESIEQKDALAHDEQRYM